VCLWDVGTGRLLHALKHDGEVLSACFSPDGGRIITGSADRHARVWDVAGGNEVVARKHPAAVRVLDVSRDGTKVLSVASLGKGDEPQDKRDPEFPEWLYAWAVAYVWEASTGRDVIDPTRVDVWADYRHDPWVRPAALSPDGSKLATSRPPAGVTVWDTGTRRALAHAPLSDRGEPGAPATGVVSQVMFTPDGGKFLTTSYDARARLWDAVSGAGTSLTDHDWRLAPAAVFARGGHRVLLSAPGGAAVLDVSTGRLLWEIEHKSSDALPAAAISPDGSLVAVGFPADGYTEIFSVNEPTQETAR
jgi:WD40 repeat protein